MEEARALEQHHLEPDAQHLRRPLELQSRVRLLDGLCVAHAEGHDAPLATTDARLVGAQLPVEVTAPARAPCIIREVDRVR